TLGKSNYGKDFVQLAARGHYISSADGDGDGFRIESGTSMAAPNITNLAAKCRMLHPALSPAQLVTLMSITSDENHSWKDAVASGGTVNNDRAMTAAATLALLASGKQLEAALDTLGVSATERPRIKTAVDALSR
ncbi:MAG: S8 family serine peptidase, partial [Flavobacteriales bacterium]|nr:S8 family serine peptidase [Flavobacteriales bacterium]